MGVITHVNDNPIEYLEFYRDKKVYAMRWARSRISRVMFCGLSLSLFLQIQGLIGLELTTLCYLTTFVMVLKSFFLITFILLGTRMFWGIRKKAVLTLPYMRVYFFIFFNMLKHNLAVSPYIMLWKILRRWGFAISL